MLEVLKYPNPELAKVSSPVTEFDETLATLLDEMAMTMYASNGIGLAAPQVGVKLRAFVVDISSHDENHPSLMEFINPIFSNAHGSMDFEEACLSVPGISEYVRRKRFVTIDYQDREGNKKQMEAEGLIAVVTQHENDHLDGVLFIERLSVLKKRLVRRKLNKNLSP